MPTTYTGAGSKFGIAKQTDYDTEASALVSLARFKPEAWAPDIVPEIIPDVGLCGEEFQDPGDQGAIPLEGTIGPFDARYQNQALELFMAQAMGAVADPAVISDGYRQVYTIGSGQYYVTGAEINTGLAGSVCTNGVHVFIGLDVTEFMLKGEGAGKVQCEVTVNGKQRILDSSENTVAQNFPSSQAGKLLMKDVVFRINDNSGDALDSDDILKLSSWTLTITRAKSVDIFATGSQYRQASEPNGHWEATFEGTLTKQNSDVWNDRFANNTLIKCDMVITGPSIGTDDYSFQFEIPRAEITKYTATPSSPERVVPEIGFKVLTSNAPTGMAAITSPIQIELVNTRTTNITA
jgi:hypothetical protein